MATEVATPTETSGDAAVTTRLGVRDRARQFSYIAKASGTSAKTPQRQPGAPPTPGVQATPTQAIETEIVDDEYRTHTQLALPTLTNEERVFLLAAVRCDYQVLAKSLHDNHQLIHVLCPFSGNSVMHFAAQKGNLDCIKLYISIAMQESMMVAGELVNARNRSGMTPLHVASLAGQTDACELLTRTYKADAELRDYAGRRARTYQNVVQRRTAKAIQRSLPAAMGDKVVQTTRAETLKRGTLTISAVLPAATLPHNFSLAEPVDKSPMRGGSALRHKSTRGAVDRSTIVHVHNPDMGRNVSVAPSANVVQLAPAAEDVVDSASRLPAPAMTAVLEEPTTPKVVRALRPVALHTTPPPPRAAATPESVGGVVEEHLAGASALRQARAKATPPKTEELSARPSPGSDEALTLRHDAITLKDAGAASSELAVRLSVAPVFVRPPDNRHLETEASSNAQNEHDTESEARTPSDQQESPSLSSPSDDTESDTPAHHVLTNQPIAEEEEEEHENSTSVEETVEKSESFAVSAEPSAPEAQKSDEETPPSRPPLRQRHSFANAFASDDELESGSNPSDASPMHTTDGKLPNETAHTEEEESDQRSESVPSASQSAEQPLSSTRSPKKRIAEAERISAIRLASEENSHESDHSETPQTSETTGTPATPQTPESPEGAEEIVQATDNSEQLEAEAVHEETATDAQKESVDKVSSSSSDDEEQGHEEAEAATNATDDEDNDFGVAFLRRRERVAEGGSATSSSSQMQSAASANSSRSTMNTSSSSRRETNI